MVSDQEFPHRIPEEQSGPGKEGRAVFAWPYVCLLLGASLVCPACDGGGSAGNNAGQGAPAKQPAVVAAVSSITVIPSASSIEVGQTRQYNAVTKDANQNILVGVTVGWSSSNQAVATIDKSGLAKAVGPGTTIIGASRDGIRSQLVNLSVTSTPVTMVTQLPPWLTYCDNAACTSLDPVIVNSCPTDSPQCMPARSTMIVPQVDNKPISGVFIVLEPIDTSVRLLSGDGRADSFSVSVFQAPKVTFGSDQDVLFSYYKVPAVWGGTTLLNFASTVSTSTLLDSVFYRHAGYDTGTVAAQLHARGQTIISAQRAMTGLTPEHVTAFFVPTELAAARGGEGNFSFGDGTVTINYGNPPYIAAQGGIMNTAMPRFAHEYTHELFNEISTSYTGNSSCMNEGVADALPFVAGFLPEEDFGPVGLRGTDFDAGCTALSESHDVGNCYFWHVKKAGLLTPAFLHEIFHPQHTYSFDSCTQNTIETGNNILVLFTEAAGGANMIPVLESMHIPHADSYAAAKQALGL
jgi:hypothetical protein